jgi:hypothetical protein
VTIAAPRHGVIPDLAPAIAGEGVGAQLKARVDATLGDGVRRNCSRRLRRKGGRRLVVPDRTRPRGLRQRHGEALSEGIGLGPLE